MRGRVETRCEATRQGPWRVSIASWRLDGEKYIAREGGTSRGGGIQSKAVNHTQMGITIHCYSFMAFPGWMRSVFIALPYS